MAFIGRSRTLFRVFGVPVKIDLSWFLILGLVVWSLAAAVFPRHVQALGGEPLSTLAYWLMGVVGALGLFASLMAHELCHSLVARRTGVPVSGITLFVFGGVSELREEPSTAASEFLMAVVGPLSSVLIGATFLVLWLVSNARGWWLPLRALLHYLWSINFLLAAFNSLPAFPLDGGRVLRSILWGITRDLRTSTHIAATVGRAFGLLMIMGGIIAVFHERGMGGIWLILIGLFLRSAAMGAMQHMLIRSQLEGERVSRFMTRNPVTVPPDLPLRRFVDDYVLSRHFTHFPVVDQDGALIGIVHARDPKKVDPATWQDATVSDVMGQADAAIRLSPDTDATEALSLLSGEDRRRLIVVEGNRPVGIVSLRDLMDFLALKIDLTPRR